MEQFIICSVRQWLNAFKRNESFWRVSVTGSYKHQSHRRQFSDWLRSTPAGGGSSGIRRLRCLRPTDTIRCRFGVFLLIWHRLQISAFIYLTACCSPIQAARRIGKQEQWILNRQLRGGAPKTNNIWHSNRKINFFKPENVAIARHSNLRPPGLRRPVCLLAEKIVIPENSTWPYLNVCKTSTFYL